MSQTNDQIPDDLTTGKPINQELLLKFLRHDFSNASALLPLAYGGTGENNAPRAIRALTENNPIFPKSINFVYNNDNVTTSIIEESEAGCLVVNDIEICGNEIWGELHGNADTATRLKTQGTEGTVPYIKTSTSAPTCDYILKMAYICETEDEVAQAKSYSPDMQVIFNTWSRFSHNNTANQPANEAEMTAWAYNANTGYIYNTTNSSTFIGVISTDTYSDYTHEVTLTSTDGDDDCIGIILAYNVDSNGVQHTLSLLRSPGGAPFTTIAKNQFCAIIYDHNKSTEWVVASSSANAFMGSGATQANGGTTLGWGSLPGCRVKAVRAGNKITVQSSQITDTTFTYDSKLNMTVDLTSDSRLQQFMGYSPIGYCAISQKNSYWKDIVFTDPTGYVFNLNTGKIEKFNGTSWVTQSGNINSIIGVGRYAFNPLTKKLFYIQPNSVKNVSTNGIADKALMLNTPRTIALSNNARGSVNFDGSANVTINTQSLIPVQAISAATTVGTGHWGKILSVTAAVTITVPKIATNGFHVIIKNRSSGNVTITPSGCSIDGSTASFTLSKLMAIQLISDGTNYVAIDTSARLQ